MPFTIAPESAFSTIEPLAWFPTDKKTKSASTDFPLLSLSFLICPWNPKDPSHSPTAIPVLDWGIWTFSLRIRLIFSSLSFFSIGGLNLAGVGAALQDFDLESLLVAGVRPFVAGLRICDCEWTIVTSMDGNWCLIS